MRGKEGKRRKRVVKEGQNRKEEGWKRRRERKRSKGRIGMRGEERKRRGEAW